MKEIGLVLLVGILNLAMFSCTPEQLVEESPEPQACCDETDPIILPPPPPPPPGEIDDN